MKYKKGFKYQTTKDEKVQTGIIIPLGIMENFITLEDDGELTIRAGYAWDGASGPTIDDDTNKTPSLVHDALYQLMRMGLLSPIFRKDIDRLFYLMCRDRGMGRLRAKIYYWAVRRFGKYTSREQDKRKVHSAP